MAGVIIRTAPSSRLLASALRLNGLCEDTARTWRPPKAPPCMRSCRSRRGCDQHYVHAFSRLKRLAWRNHSIRDRIEQFIVVEGCRLGPAFAPSSETPAQSGQKWPLMPEHRQQISNPPPLEPSADQIRVFGPAEKKRLVERHDLGQDFYDRHRRKDEAAFRAAVLDELAERDERDSFAGYASFDHNSQTLDNPTAFRSATITALMDRIHSRASQGQAAAVFADGEAAFARRILKLSGVDCRGWSDSRVLRSYLTTSAFALIAGGVTDLRVTETYNAAASPITQVFGKRTVDDFNVHTEALVDWTTLKIDKVNEHGEYKYSFVDETGEIRHLCEFLTGDEHKRHSRNQIEWFIESVRDVWDEVKDQI